MSQPVVSVGPGERLACSHSLLLEQASHWTRPPDSYWPPWQGSTSPALTTTRLFQSYLISPLSLASPLAIPCANSTRTPIANGLHADSKHKRILTIESHTRLTPVIKTWPWRHPLLQEAPRRHKSLRRAPHANGAASHDDEDAGLGILRRHGACTAPNV